MGLWTRDLTTRDAADGATGLASIGCFIMAGLSVPSGLVALNLLNGARSELLAGALGAIALEFLVFLIAGFRLRIGKGLGWGIAATVILAIETLFKLVTLSPLGLIIDGIVLVAVINGVRGAAAMRRGFVDYDAEAEVFR